MHESICAVITDSEGGDKLPDFTGIGWQTDSRMPGWFHLGEALLGVERPGPVRGDEPDPAQPVYAQAQGQPPDDLRGRAPAPRGLHDEDVLYVGVAGPVTDGASHGHGPAAAARQRSAGGCL